MPSCPTMTTVLNPRSAPCPPAWRTAVTLGSVSGSLQAACYRKPGACRTASDSSQADGHALRAGVGAAGQDARFGVTSDYLHRAPRAPSSDAPHRVTHLLESGD